MYAILDVFIIPIFECRRRLRIPMLDVFCGIIFFSTNSPYYQIFHLNQSRIRILFILCSFDFLTTQFQTKSAVLYGVSFWVFAAVMRSVTTPSFVTNNQSFHRDLSLLSKPIFVGWRSPLKSTHNFFICSYSFYSILIRLPSIFMILKQGMCRACTSWLISFCRSFLKRKPSSCFFAFTSHSFFICRSFTSYLRIITARIWKE